MSTSAGVSQRAQTISVQEGGQVQVPGGGQIDVTTAEGLAQAQALVDPAELDAAMQAAGFKLQGNHYVANDDFQMRRQVGVQGPGDNSAGATDLDRELGARVFGNENFYNAQSVNALEQRVGGTREFQAAVTTTQAYVNNPNPQTLQSWTDALPAVGAVVGKGNPYDLIFLLFRESIKDTNENKRYFLKKLQTYNKIGDALSEHMKDMSEASISLANQTRGAKAEDAQKKTVAAPEIRTYDLENLHTKNGMEEPQVMRTKSPGGGGRANQDQLKNGIDIIRGQQEDLRTKKSMAETAFKNQDQITNQFFNMLTNLEKTLKEMGMTPIRNML